MTEAWQCLIHNYILYLLSLIDIQVIFYILLLQKDSRLSLPPGLRALGGKSEDYYDYYDYNYYAGFEVLRKPEKIHSAKSTRHKIQTQFSGTSQAQETPRRARPLQSKSVKSIRQEEDPVIKSFRQKEDPVIKSIRQEEKPVISDTDSFSQGHGFIFLLWYIYLIQRVQ